MEDAIAQMRFELDELASKESFHQENDHTKSDEQPIQVNDAPNRSPSLRGLVLRQITAGKPLTRPQQAVLFAIEQLESARPLLMHRTPIACLAGFGPNDKLFQSTISSLNDQGLIVARTRTATLTEEGKKRVLGQSISLTSEKLADCIAAQLTRPQRAIFKFIFTKRGAGVSKDEILGACEIGKNEKNLQKELNILLGLALIDQVAGGKYSYAEMLLLD